MQLLGIRGRVDDGVVEACADVGMDKRLVWGRVRKVLKTLGCRGMYNRIPEILRRLGWGIMHVDWVKIRRVIRYRVRRAKKGVFRG